MNMPTKTYFIRVATALSVLINVIFGGNLNQTFSIGIGRETVRRI
jgi:hypothetical protein